MTDTRTQAIVSRPLYTASCAAQHLTSDNDNDDGGGGGGGDAVDLHLPCICTWVQFRIVVPLPPGSKFDPTSEWKRSSIVVAAPDAFPCDVARKCNNILSASYLFLRAEGLQVASTCLGEAQGHRRHHHHRGDTYAVYGLKQLRLRQSVAVYREAVFSNALYV